jgi:hypothetical protein
MIGPEICTEAEGTLSSDVLERRRALRYPCRLPCFVRPAGATGCDDWPGLLYNMSTHGLGLVLYYEPRVGTILHVAANGKRPVRPLRARIVRSVFVECAWFHGCELLDPMTEEELRAWLT